VHVAGDALPGAQSGSSWSPSRWAASDHWIFRWLVGATTTSRPPPVGTLGAHAARVARAQVSANVVLPAPGVATARKSGSGEARNRSKAARCHGRSVTVDMGVC
jgi:hypothetical protein